jgi:putative SOS response-associated peptidase YedK
MCGRYLILSSPQAFRRLFGYPQQPSFPPRYNVAPTQPVPIVRTVEGARGFALARWGLIPPWVKDPRNFTLLVNARAESVNEKPAFRNAMRRRRCLFPADGFYEWKDEGGRKRPFCVRPKDRQPIAFAGLWEIWMGPNGEEMETAAIITSNANRELAPLHPRMPVVIPAHAFDMWLDCASADAFIAAALLDPAPEGFFEAYAVSSTVNRAANEGPALIEPLAPEPSPPAAEPAAALPRKRARARNERQPSLFDDVT